MNDDLPPPLPHFNRCPPFFPFVATKTFSLFFSTGVPPTQRLVPSFTRWCGLIFFFPGAVWPSMTFFFSLVSVFQANIQLPLRRRCGSFSSLVSTHNITFGAMFPPPNGRGLFSPIGTLLFPSRNLAVTSSCARKKKLFTTTTFPPFFSASFSVTIPFFFSLGLQAKLFTIIGGKRSTFLKTSAGVFPFEGVITFLFPKQWSSFPFPLSCLQSPTTRFAPFFPRERGPWVNINPPPPFLFFYLVFCGAFRPAEGLRISPS